MSRSLSDRRFADFCRDGEPRDLAAVFDATAPELHRVARYLVRDSHAADDVLQATFLVAIERRERFNQAQPVLPWLLGILANLAREDRRRRQRAMPARNLSPGTDPATDPASAAAHAEFQQDLGRALRELNEPYREVLLLQLEHGLDNAAIAEVTGRKAATVRTQVARGMEALRRLLPAGTGVTVAVVATTPSHSLAAIRTVVLRSAETALPVVAVAIGTLTMKKLLLPIVAVALAGLAIILLPNWSGDDAAPRSSDFNAPASVDQDAAIDGAGAAPIATPNTVRTKVVGEVGSTLSIVAHRADGVAVTDLGVLVQADGLGPLGREQRTDASGRVTFDALRPGPVVIAPDRAPARNVTLAVGHNHIDLRLPLGIDVTGRVVDPAGTPVPGAEVFAASLVHPGRAVQLTIADKAGNFAIPGVTPQTQLFARASGRQPGRPRPGTVDGRPGQPLSMTLRVGARGFNLTGRVLDANGAAVPHAQVAVCVDEDCQKHVDGTLGRQRRSSGNGKLDREVFLLQADADGRYASDEIPAGDTVLIARALRGGAAGVAITRRLIEPAGNNHQDLVLQPGGVVVGTVRDEKGAPFAGLPVLIAWQGTEVFGELEDGLADFASSVATTTDSDGAYRVSDLLPGEHRLRAGSRLNRAMRVTDAIAAPQQLTLVGAETVRRDLIVARRGDLRVRLLGPNKAPLVGWAIWADRSARANMRMSTLEAQRTDADGCVTLRDRSLGLDFYLSAHAPLPASAGDRLVDRVPAKRWSGVRVDRRELELHVSGDELPTSSIVGRLMGYSTSKHRTEPRLLRRDWHEHRRFAVHEDGAFVASALPAGEYYVRPMTAGDPLLGPFLVAAGEQLELGEVEVPAPGKLRIRPDCEDGRSITSPRAMLVRPDGLDGPWQLRDEGPLLVTGNRAPGRYVVFLWGTDLAPSRYEVEITSGGGEVRRLTGKRGFLQPFAAVLPLGAAALPFAPNAELCEYDLFVDLGGEMTHVGRGHSATLAFKLPLQPGRWMVRVEVAGYERVYHEFECGEAPTASIRIPLTVAER